MPHHLRHHLRALTAAATLAALAGGGIAAGALAASPRAAAFPKTVAAHPIPAVRPPFPRPGTVVRSTALFATRTFANDKVGFALADVTAGGGAQFPARTTDGGRTWRINGPYFHVDAADAPNAVSGTGMLDARTYFAFGGSYGGQAIDVTTDAGAHWWRAFLPTPPQAVLATRITGRLQLIAFLQGSPTHSYVSTDGGRHWRRTT